MKMNKLKAILTLFQKGSMVIDPALWKSRQITVTILSSVIWAGLKLGGLDEQIGSETVDAVAIGILALVNAVFTITTTEKIGLPTKRKPNH